jgi:ethanolamine ammonia-lyase large subunit
MLDKIAGAVTPEMAAAVSKLMRNQDLIAVAKKCEVVTRFRDTIGLKGISPPVYSPIIQQMILKVSQPA